MGNGKGAPAGMTSMDEILNFQQQVKYAALYADNATTAGRASNLSMGLNGTDLWVYYS